MVMLSILERFGAGDYDAGRSVGQRTCYTVPSDQDIRHRFRFSPTWVIPGKKTPWWAGQMLEGWAVSGGLSLQGGLPWMPLDNTKDDFVGTGENANRTVPTPNNGVFQTWNYSGPRSAFTSSNIPIPCYGKLVPGCAGLRHRTRRHTNRLHERRAGSLYRQRAHCKVSRFSRF